MCWLRGIMEEKLCPERKWIWQRWWKGLKMDEVAFQHLCDGADRCTAQLNNSWGKAGNREVLIFGRGSRRGGLARKSIGFLPTDGFDSNGREVLAASFLSQFSHHSRLHNSHPVAGFTSRRCRYLLHSALLSLCSSIWLLLTLSQLNRRVVFSSGSAPVGILTCMHVEPCGTFWSWI